ncbi:mitochondrial 37S ribosomal protein MRPS5 [Aspergillus lentulus]|uniref:Mitochondrial 37S ribosomal protein MRPS5 n=1 Tax=Aspergillus lentulus TaxID=293939 RepID=A0ABQ0ZUL9_ASPLE|nr:mitochondrial 37S ribosomal protein MRPS5 [Aspergillus lentulus]GFF37980.1 mitochondrial 37S ribosomal protein MRPS5 [Aspergillus lentulus]GFF45957.1 mitochondrial 37S ribosomal protein MRPS5 [Aspergillus lentulus]GFF64033.1 mitochondrial 37S ribosomal protein MRPS5 [Aspergillus lentulus]GFF65227.1 mitochondrial 37S ribosomal protein MRPS5 [Aspergillus lentulus]
MSVVRPVRCLFCSFSRPASAVPRVPRRQFHPSPAQLANRKPKFPNVKADNLKSLEEISRSLKPEDFKPYTEEEKARLQEEYTPEQMAAIEAGEAAIDPKDLAEQFAIRRDPMKLHYLDDFSTIEPGVDKHVRAPVTNTDYNAELKSESDFAEDFGRFLAELPRDPTAADWVRFAETLRMTHGKEENELNPHSALVPDLLAPGESISGERKEINFFKETDPKARESEEITDALKQLLLTTGYSQREIQDLRTKTLVSHAVVNQTRLGKVRRQYCLSIAGNGNGLLGIGEAKSEEPADAQTQSRYRAIRNMQPIPRYEDRTIFGDVEGKVGAVQLKLMTRPPGFGLRCQHLIFEMCRACGIHDLAARVARSRNPMNTVKAAYEALMSQRNPEDIARARGKKLVDVRKVYYSGRA